MAKSRKLRRSPKRSRTTFEARECGGEGGKPGPCAEHHAEAGHPAHHGVGGAPNKEDIHEVNRRIGMDPGRASTVKLATAHQAQVHTDVQHIVGKDKVYGGTMGSNARDHGKAGVLHSEVEVSDKDSDGPKKLKKLREYADENGLRVDMRQIPGTGDKPAYTRVKLSSPREPPNERQKDVMRMRNAAMNDGEDTALHTLGDKLEEMGAPLAPKLAAKVNANDYEGARKLIREHEDAYGSVLSKGGKLGMGGRGGQVTESVVRKRRWQATESCECGTCIRIDKDKGIIYNALILGNESKNGRKYLREAKEDAVSRGLYEGLQLYIGPHKKGRFAKRSPNDHAGELRNVKVMANDEVRGDIHYNRASRGGRLTLELAERFPKAFGLSQHAWVDGYEQDGKKIITEIAEIAVVDVVKDPGTTTNIFEDTNVADDLIETVEDGDTETVAPPAPVDTGAGGDWKASINDLIGQIHDSDLDDDMKLKATKVLMKLKKELAGEPADEEEPVDDEPAPEAVDVKALIKRIEALEKPRAKPKARARTEHVEDVNPPAPPKAPALPKSREDVLKAYEVED